MAWDEGADSHAMGTNLSLMSQVLLEWLDEVLDAEAQPIALSASSVEAQAHAATLVR